MKKLFSNYRPRKVILLIAGMLSCVVLAWLALFAIDVWNFRRLFELIGPNEHGLLEYRHRGSGIVMVLVPGGEFTTGSGDGELGHQPDEIQQPLSLNPFLIAREEVTQEVWMRIMGTNPSVEKGNGLPAHGMSWYEAVEFCQKTTLLLPSEYEWEYACKAGSQCISQLGALVPALSNEIRPHLAGSIPANDLGLYDMLGNVAEWCRDIRPTERQERAHGRPVESQAAFRGAFWGSDPALLRCAERAWCEASWEQHAIGLRPVWIGSGARFDMMLR